MAMGVAENINYLAFDRNIKTWKEHIIMFFFYCFT